MKIPLNLLSGVAVATCLLFGGSAMAQTMSSSDFSAGKTRIKADYKVDKKSAAQLKVAEEKCDTLASTAKDNCLKKAKAAYGKL